MTAEIQRNSIDLHVAEGLSLLSEGDFKGALSAFERAICNKSNDAVALYNAGVACHRLGQFPQAIGYYLRAIQAEPQFIEAFFNLGNASIQTDNLPQAVLALQKAIEIDPSYCEAYYNLGIALERMGDCEKALAAYDRVIRIHPGHDRALNNIGLIQCDRKNADQALHYFKRAIAANPKLAEAHYNLGIALQENAEYDEGIQHIRKAIEINPEYAPARWFSLLSLPKLYPDLESIHEYRAQFRRNLEQLIAATPLNSEGRQRNALEGAGVFTNFRLQYQGMNDIEIQERYGRFIHGLMKTRYPHWSHPVRMPREPGEKIRIGYFSTFMYGHTVGDLLLGWIQHHCRDDFDIYCYYTGTQNDPITREIRSAVAVFRQITGGLELVAKSIATDRLHVLVYPDIGMNPQATLLAALRLAPVQCVFWGHPVTTGLPTMDYFLTSDLMEPADADEHYTERLIRLPNLSICFTPPTLPSNPKSRSEFGLLEDRFVYLSSQSLIKYLPQHDDIYPEIAALVPQAQFAFISDSVHGATAYFKNRLFSAFRRHGLDGARFCHFLPKMNHADFLSLNLCADVLLDTMEWSGGHTTLEGLACDLPVVTLPGGLMRGRHSFAMLKMMDLQDTIAKDQPDYIRIAARLAQDRGFYKKIREHVIRNKHRVFKDRTVIDRLEDFYRSVVDRPEGSVAIRCPSKQKDRAGTGSALPPESSEEACYLRLLDREPENIEAAFALASLYLRSNNGDQALKWLRKVQARMPESAVVLNNIGKAYMLKGDRSQAREMYHRACTLDPKLAEAWFNLAELDQSSDRVEQAIAHYQKALAINPIITAAYNNMGNALRDLKRYAEAVAAFNQVVTLEPDLAQGHYNLGSAFRCMDRYSEAMVHLSRAIELQPAYADAWNNLALTCKNIGDMDRALNYFNKALQLQPDFAVAHWNRSFVHFLKGNWPEGWQDFEWRFRVPHWRTIYPHRISGKLWCGDPMKNQTLLVHDEQGLGDAFQFIRYLPWARERCGRLIFETRSELAPLLEKTLGIDELVIRSCDGPPEVAFDQYVPLMSLGRIVNADPNHMSPTEAYIRAPGEKAAQWGQRVPARGLNIGLVWAGRPEHGNDANRSCQLELFAPLFDLPGFNFIGLQKGPAAAEAEQMPYYDKFQNWGPELESFSDTAGLMQHLDLVLTVDTSVAHLAGAMGRPVWVLIPFLPDWRWGMNTAETGWYPTMRLFRQPRPKDWNPVIGQIIHFLQVEAPRMKSVRRSEI